MLVIPHLMYEVIIFMICVKGMERVEEYSVCVIICVLF